MKEEVKPLLISFRVLDLTDEKGYLCGVKSLSIRVRSSSGVKSNLENILFSSS
jgi:hypothetical protein